MTTPPGGPHFQPPYAPPPGQPGYGQPPGYPAGGPPAPGYGQPGAPGFGQPGGAGPAPGYGPPAAGYGQGAGYAGAGPAVGGVPAPGFGGGPTGGYAGPSGAPPGYAPPGVGPASPPAGFGGPPAAAFGPPAGGYGPAAGGPPVVIDVGKTNGRKALIGAVVAGVLGLAAIIGGIAVMADGDGSGVVALILGLLLLALPLALVARKDKIFRPQLLVFEAAGLRWDDPKGAPWAVPWSELGAVSVSKHSPQQGPESVQDKLVGAASDKIVGERAHVRLDIYPADPGFAGRHPEMAHLWERQGVKNGYRLPLGSNVKFIPTIATAMGRFAPQIYRGVNATEGFMGLS